MRVWFSESSYSRNLAVDYFDFYGEKMVILKVYGILQQKVLRMILYVNFPYIIT